ncbi:MAG: hypothetical protein LUQ01_00605 [Methanolinea sp.]|nr:hypothetical protein [Methanolinea sp.]
MKLKRRTRTAAVQAPATPARESPTALYAATLIHSSMAVLLFIFVIILLYPIPG